MKKNIVFLIQSLHGGGAERVLSNLANQMHRNGHDVTIIVRRKHPNRYPVDYGIDLHYVKSASIFSYVREARTIIKRKHADNVIAFEYFYNMLACLICLGLKTNLIISERNDPALIGSGIFKTPLRNFLYRFCNTLVCQTDDAKAFFPPYIQAKAIVILNPLRSGLPEPYNGARENKIVNFCRLSKQKNIPLLIDSFNIFKKYHEDYELHIYGEGEAEQDIINYIKSTEVSDSVFLHHFSNSIHSDILNYKMFVSSSDYEGLSNSMLEAMAIGLPTIVTDCPCGGARMVIKNGQNGIITPVKDKNSISEAMAFIADNESVADRISKEGTRLRDKLSLDNIGAMWEKLLK